MSQTANNTWHKQVGMDNKERICGANNGLVTRFKRFVTCEKCKHLLVAEDAKKYKLREKEEEPRPEFSKKKKKWYGRGKDPVLALRDFLYDD